ncbi:MAG: hypothetical protein IJB22_04110, partial [Clostridia bacterium]|nr:hypothetical protein [Clostridia bacterium]
MKYESWRGPDTLNDCVTRTQKNADSLVSLAGTTEKVGKVIFGIFCTAAVVLLIAFFAVVGYGTDVAIFLLIGTVSAAFIALNVRFCYKLASAQLRAKADIVENTEI